MILARMIPAVGVGGYSWVKEPAQRKGPLVAELHCILVPENISADVVRCGRDNKHPGENVTILITGRLRGMAGSAAPHGRME